MRKFKGVLLALLLLSPFCSSAKFPGLLKRYQLGYSFVMNSGTLEVTNKIPVLNFDTSYTQNFSTSAAFGITTGTYIPLKRLGRTSTLNLGIDYMYNMMTWKASASDGGFDGATVQMALPIGLDFKFGADALTVKNHRFCATLGFGAYPAYGLTVIDATALTIDPAFSVAPYAKIEAGIFAGICMKVRALAAFGKINYMDYKSPDGNTTNKFYGNTNFAISLLIMPFSFTWQQEDWWNTY